MRALLLLLGLGTVLTCQGAEVGSPCAVAREQIQELARTWGGEAEVRCLGVSARTPSLVRWRAASLPQRLKAGPMNWPLEWLGPTGWSAATHPVVVRWSLPVAVTRTRLPAQHRLQDGDLQVAMQVLPPGFDLPPPATGTLQGLLRRPLPSGALVSESDLLSPDSLPSGHALSVVLRQGSLELRLPGRLVAPARPGSEARVQLQGRREVLQGRVLDAQTLVVENEG